MIPKDDESHPGFLPFACLFSHSIMCSLTYLITYSSVKYSFIHSFIHSRTHSTSICWVPGVGNTMLITVPTLASRCSQSREGDKHSITINYIFSEQLQRW